MSKSLAIITLHGMGKVKKDYHEDFEETLQKALGIDAWEQHIHLEPIQYQPSFQSNEDAVWQRMNAFPLDASLLRRFLLFGFADAGSLEYSAHRDKVVYKEIQHHISNAFQNAYAALNTQAKPVIIIAQSLGCQVLSNYIWDSQHNLGIFSDGPHHDAAFDAFRRLATCEYLVTTGCNIPLFVSGLPDIKCFDRPNPNFTWHNFYDKDDALGWPLSPLSESFRQTVNLDMDVNAGGLLTSWHAYSHGQYWTDKSVLKHMIRQIKAMLAHAPSSGLDVASPAGVA